MHPRKSVALVIVLGIICTVHALDGILIANILPAPTYRWEFTPGKLVKYTIAGDYVTKVDTLGINDGHSPVINKSGTYFAYIRRRTPTDQFNRTLVIRSIDGAGQSKEIPLAGGAVWVWWGLDGNFFYTVNPHNPGSQTRISGQYYVRRLSLKKNSAGQLETEDRLWAKLEAAIQGGFVGMDDRGAHLGYSSGGTWALSCLEKPSCELNSTAPRAQFTGGWTMNGDTTQYVVNSKRVIPGLGCGWSVSPSGKFVTQWVGGHNWCHWWHWVPADSVTPLLNASFKVINANWAVYRDSDPEGKLEISLDSGKTWEKNPIGVMGQDNCFAVNSDHWTQCEIGIAHNTSDAFNINVIALSPKHRKAINVTKIMPFSSQPVTAQNQAARGQLFRGVTFTGDSRCADRGSLWVSNRDDVLEEYRHFLDNRADDNRYWSELLGLPLVPVNATARQHAHPIQGGIKLTKATRGYNVDLPVDADFTIDVVDFAGRTVRSIQGSGRSVNSLQLGNGAYIIRVRQLGQVYKERIVAF